MTDLAVVEPAQEVTGRKYNKEAAVPQLTKKAAEELVGQFMTKWQDSRGLLLEMYEGKAHKALGFGSWEEFCQVRLGIQASDRTINNNLAAARVVRGLQAIAPEDATIASLPVTAAVELNKLPKAQWADVYKEYEALDTGKRTPKETGSWMKRIVGRRLGKAKVAPVTPAKKADFTPVKADTYDGSEEQQAAEEAQANGNVPEGHSPSEIMESPVRASGEAANGISVSEYGTVLGFCRRLVQVYGSDGQALAELVAEVEAFLKDKDGRG